MSVKKTEQGWLADVRPAGRTGKRFRKTFDTKAEALRYEAWLVSSSTSPAWQPKKQDTRRLADLIKIWWESHGQNLKAGEDTHSRLKLLCNSLNNPLARELTPTMFTAYRAKRLEDPQNPVAPATLNREHAYLRAVFGELKRLGEWAEPNPLTGLRQIKVDQAELAFLTLPQIDRLMTELRAAKKNIHAALTTELALATGARWGEAQGITIQQVQTGIVQFTKTKSSKLRHVPINSQLEGKLRTHHSLHGNAEHGNRIFEDSYGAFLNALERSGIELPAGQATHVLRHTFASHFLQNGGNIVALQKLLGHSSLNVTMRYAHMSPQHLEEARKLNPLAAWESGEWRVERGEGAAR